MWVAVSHQAFFVIEELKFHEMIADLNIEAESMILKSANTIREWVVREFKKQKQTLVETLRQS